MPRKPRGLTLVELVVALTIFTVALGALYSTFRASQDAIYQCSIQTDLDMAVTALADRIAGDLRDSGPAYVSIQPYGQNPSISFLKSTGFDPGTGTLTTSPRLSYRCEVLNGRTCLTRYDEDGNQMVLSDQIVPSFAGNSALDVAPIPLGFAIGQPDPSRISISITLGKRNESFHRNNPAAPDPRSYMQFSTATTTVTMQNP